MCSAGCRREPCIASMRTATGSVTGSFRFRRRMGSGSVRTTVCSSPTPTSMWCESSTGTATLLQTIGTPGRRAHRASRSIFRRARCKVRRGTSMFPMDTGRTGCIDSAPTATLIVSWGGDGSEPGQFQTPHGIWVDADERVYVVDRANGRVQVFDNDGHVLAIWEGFCFPHDIYQTASGTFIVTDCATRDDDSRPYSRADAGEPTDRADRGRRADRRHGVRADWARASSRIARIRSGSRRRGRSM